MLFTIFILPLLFIINITKLEIIMEKVTKNKRMKLGENYFNEMKG